MNLRTLMILTLALFCASGYSQVKETEQLKIEIDKLLGKQYKDNEPGAAVLIARKGEVIFKKAYGKANLELDVALQPEHVFKIGSVTKQFTAVAILQLMEQGKLDLQDEITKFIPDYPTQGHRITIEHLLTHTSGIQNYSAIRDTARRGTVDFSPKEMVDYFKNHPIRFPPGSAYQYSNSGYFLLGYIIELITKKTYAEYLEENIFKPAGMSNSRYGSDIKLVRNRADGYSKGKGGFENAVYISMTQPYAAGSILSTVEDLYKWHSALYEYKLIKKENLEKAVSRYKLSDGKESSYGYGWRQGFVYESASIWHGGMIFGFIAMEMYLPKEDIFVVVLTNCDCNSPETITSKLAALANGRSFDHKEIALEAGILQQYPGVYDNDKGQFRIISLEEGKLYTRSGRGPRTVLKAIQKDQFFIDELSEVGFTRNKAGKIENMISRNLGGNEKWVKSDRPIPTLTGIEVDEKILESYVGRYEISPGVNFDVTRDQKRLFAQVSGQEKFEVFADSPTRFFFTINEAELEFNKDRDGRVAEVLLKQGGRVRIAKKIK